ncbi:MAG TPA: glycosyltransferase family 2 protein [bacterium]|nr:glycosyltransferase family 2 protein [bacterium]
MDVEHRPLVSIVIPHWNHREVLVQCLESLSRTHYAPVGIIVVDNASSDDSVAYVHNHFSDVRIIRNEQNLGFAGGCNRGIEAAGGKYVVILNNDTTQTPDWLSILVEFMEQEPAVGIAQPKLINSADPTRFDYSGAAGGFMDKFAFPFARGRMFDHVEQDHGQYDEATRIFWASGTACIIRREVFDQVGLFDETFFAHMEEIDLNWRAQLAGWDIAAVPDAVVYHHSGYTLPMESPFKKYLNHRNSLLMPLGNYQLRNMIVRGIQRAVLDIMACGFSLLSWDFHRFLAILKAWGWILIHPGEIWRKRAGVRSIRDLTDRELDTRLYQGSVALDRYLFGRSVWESERHRIGDFQRS